MRSLMFFAHVVAFLAALWMGHEIMALAWIILDLQHAHTDRLIRIENNQEQIERILRASL